MIFKPNLAGLESPLIHTVKGQCLHQPFAFQHIVLYQSTYQSLTTTRILYHYM